MYSNKRRYLFRSSNASLKKKRLIWSFKLLNCKLRNIKIIEINIVIITWLNVRRKINIHYVNINDFGWIRSFYCRLC